MTHTHETKTSDVPRVTGRRILATGRALELQQLDWRDAENSARTWETAERVNGRGAVLILPVLLPSRRVVLIRQYRPPAGCDVLEFPAGLIDEGEDPPAAAVRELAEETGYHGMVSAITPPTYNSPGLSSETVCQVYVDIDETRPENATPQAEPESGEHIEVVLVPLADSVQFLKTEFDAGRKVDSKVAAAILGMRG